MKKDDELESWNVHIPRSLYYQQEKKMYEERVQARIERIKEEIREKLKNY